MKFFPSSMWLILLLSVAFTPYSVSAQAFATTTNTVFVAPSTTTDQESPESILRSYFSDLPIMIEIARCESQFRQFTDSGTVLGTQDGSGMIGLFQISEIVHKNTALSLNMDIYTTKGNIAYARYLYTNHQTDPWVSSFPCWNKNPVPESSVSATSSPASSPLTTNLSFGMIHPEVLTLQQILNAKGFLVATSGPGSIGNETDKFGNLTRKAVRNFQCTRNIVCTGDEFSSSYGVVGLRTREALAQYTPGSQVPETSFAPQIQPATPMPIPDHASATIASLIAQIEHITKLISELQAKRQSMSQSAILILSTP